MKKKDVGAKAPKPSKSKVDLSGIAKTLRDRGLSDAAMMELLKTKLDESQITARAIAVSVLPDLKDWEEQDESRKVGGNLRAEQLTNQKKDKHKAIEEKEKELALKFAAHKLNKEIAKALGLETDYVRKARGELKKKKSADS